jgi:hypothetical protein
MIRAGSHANLVEFRGWYRDAEQLLCLVMGYCEGGTLAQLIKVWTRAPVRMYRLGAVL